MFPGCLDGTNCGKSEFVVRRGIQKATFRFVDNGSKQLVGSHIDLFAPGSSTKPTTTATGTADYNGTKGADYCVGVSNSGCLFFAGFKRNGLWEARSWWDAGAQVNYVADIYLSYTPK